MPRSRRPRDPPSGGRRRTADPSASARATERDLGARHVGDQRRREPALPAHGPARPSSSSRQAVAAPPRTTRSAPSRAVGTSAAARSMTPSATAAAGPRPDGLHAACVQPAAAARGAQGARDRPVDQPEAQEGDPHGGRPRPGQSYPAGVVGRGRTRGDRRPDVDASDGRPRAAPPRLRAGRGRLAGSGGGSRCRRSLSRRSSRRLAPQRGQRRSSANSASSGAVV